jgi:cbb3-type cytochrome oxidase subunit 3
MLPVWIVLACIGFVLKQIGLAALILISVAMVVFVVWRLRRRSQSIAIKPDSTPP